MSKVWFITGAGRGFGREFALAALSRGDSVAATARDVTALAELVGTFGSKVLPLALDVTDAEGVRVAVTITVESFGRLDVVVNNAGYGLFGAVEELGEQQLRDQLEVNLFGAFHVTQSALPILRAQGSGHIIQISTIGGIAAFPLLGGYHASKWALEGMTESLAQEVAPFGVKVTLIEPGAFATDWAGSSAVWADKNPAYEAIRTALLSRSGTAPEPRGFGDAILAIVNADHPPLRVLFGEQPTHLVKALYAKRLETWAEWENVSLQAEGR